MNECIVLQGFGAAVAELCSVGKVNADGKDLRERCLLR